MTAGDAPLPEWLRQASDGALTLSLLIQPGAKRNEFVGPHGGALKIRLTAPPVDRKANTALIRFLAQRLGVAASSVRILSGETSRQKIVWIATVDLGLAARVIQAALPPVNA